MTDREVKIEMFIDEKTLKAFYQRLEIFLDEDDSVIEWGEL